ncbi:MAG: hypothetical protein R2932_05830 [Caldilineaceae bacterium]
MIQPQTPNGARSRVTKAAPSSLPQVCGSNEQAQRFIPLQSAPFWNGCGRPEAIQACVLVKHRARQVLTAIRTLDNRLRLFSWRVNADGTVLCTGTTDAAVNDVTQITLIHARKYVSACRTQSGSMHLQCWDVSNTGAIYPSGPATVVGGGLQWVTLLLLTPELVITIGLRRDGFWELTTWAISDDAAPQQLDQMQMPATNGALAATLLAAPNNPIADHGAATFVTVMHVAPNQLRWNQWQAHANGRIVLQQQVEQTHPAIVDLALTTVDQSLVTVLHGADGRLQVLHGWPAADPIAAGASEPVTIAERVRHFSIAKHDSQLMLAHVAAPLAPVVATPSALNATTSSVIHPDSGTPELTTVEMHQWQPATAQWIDCGTGTLPSPTATDLALCNEPLDGNAPFLTAIGTTSGELHLVTWADASQTPQLPQSC